MLIAAQTAAKEGVTGLVWSVFGNHAYTVSIENGYGEFLGDVVNQLLETFTAQARFVLEHRYGFNGCSPMTYRTLGQICPRLREWDFEKKRSGALLKFEDGAVGLSYNRVRQIEHNALRKLRHPSRSQWLLTFVTRTKEDEY